MSTYYEYQDVKIMIAHKLMKMDGWKVYGYSADQSDSMTDYYCPAHWGGVAEKNGYILCVDVYGARQPEEIRQYNFSGFSYDSNIADKIKKLEQMTGERGASEQEEASAKISIERLQKKAEEATENANKYIVTGIVPGHMENPSRCNWHIEKDGIIIAKGNGILKYASVDSYYSYNDSMKQYHEFKTLGADEWEKKNAKYLLNHSCHYETEEESSKGAKYNRERLEKDSILIEEFEKFINKVDTTCGGLLGDGDGIIYEKVTVTEYKKELKAVQTTTGEVKEGQLFKLMSNFNYGHNKGQVFRIHETEYNGKKNYHAYKLNGKRTKECTGRADSSNSWHTFNEKFLKWIADGTISWCELQEVKTPYEVEKVVKKTFKAEKKPEQKITTKATEETSVDINNLTFEVSEDTDTRTNENIYLVKVVEKLNREEYVKVNQYIKTIGGYYSKFKHAFLFKDEPTKILNATPAEKKTEETPSEETETLQTETKKETVKYNIEEDIHTKTGEKIYIVKPDAELNKQDFAEVKRKFATLQGFYSGFKHGFIFKYDPTEKLTMA